MSVLLLGHSGYLGSYLHNNLLCDHDVFPRKLNYDFIINCIGKPDLEYCEKNPEVSYVSNYSVVLPFIKKYSKSKLITFSSYYVYDDVGECSETANTTDKYFYTAHKLLSEKIAVENSGVVFRLGKIFGNVGFLNRGKLTEHIILNSELKLDLIKFNPVSVEQIKNVVEFELKNKAFLGVYNLCNSGCTTAYDYGIFIKTFLGKEKRLRMVDKIPRIFHNYGRFLMSTKKLNTVIALNDWQTDLERYLEEVKCIV
jgi:dTDP-4-dehydrorhamnose reductase